MKNNWLLVSLYVGCSLAWPGYSQNDDPELMKINGKSIKRSEFEYIYNKNNQQQIDNKSLDEYVTLFKNYKLKVAEAEANGIDPALAENPNAKFPRLTYGENKNNNQESTFWLADGKYLRLKNVDVSYRFTNNWLKSRVGVESATLSLIGENLHVWDKVKLFDPSQASGNGAEYPLQRMYTLQLNLTF